MANHPAFFEGGEVDSARMTLEDLEEAKAVADGLSIVDAPKPVEDVRSQAGSGPVVTLGHDEFARIQAEHNAAEAFKKSHGFGGLE